MLPLSHSTPYSGNEGDVLGFAGSGELAQALTQQACQGTDLPLAMPLPHTRVMQNKRGGHAPSRHEKNLSCHYFILRYCNWSIGRPLAVVKVSRYLVQSKQCGRQHGRLL